MNILTSGTQDVDKFAVFNFHLLHDIIRVVDIDMLFVYVSYSK
jgi:hypothetical protein